MSGILSCIYYPFYVFSREMSIQILCPFLKNGVAVLLLSCISSLCILDTRPLPDMQFVNIFAHFVGCVFTFLMVSFKVQQF